MKLSNIGADMLIAREANILHAYDDSENNCTVGIGHLLHKGPCTAEDKARWANITREQSLALFKEDLISRENVVNNYVKVSLTQNQFDALVSFVFNVGSGIGTKDRGFVNSTLLRKLNAGDYEGAATAFMMWNKPSAIIGRRRTEMNQFRTPYGNQTPVPQTLISIATGPIPMLRGPSTKFAKAEWLHPVFRVRLEQLHNEVPFTNKSGGRSRQRQAELYRAYIAYKTGKSKVRANPANAPGTSWHEYDENGSTLAQAADIHPVRASFATLHKAAKKYGIHFPVAKEGWHAQPIEAKSSSRKEGQGLGPVQAYWNPQSEDEEEDMLLLQTPDPGEIVVVFGNKIAGVPTIEDATALIKAGVKLVHVSKALVDLMRAAV
jgi:GH24 family phage-related lysozyme (muramidase)